MNIPEPYCNDKHLAKAYERGFNDDAFTARTLADYGDGGWRIMYDNGDHSSELFASEEEAAQAAKDEGWGGTELQHVPSCDAILDAYQAGADDADSTEDEPTDPVKFAQDWHDGQDSGLYRFQCNGGTFPDYDTAFDCEAECSRILGKHCGTARLSAADEEACNELLEAARDYMNEPPQPDNA